MKNTSNVQFLLDYFAKVLPKVVVDLWNTVDGSASVTNVVIGNSVSSSVDKAEMADIKVDIKTELRYRKDTEIKSVVNKLMGEYKGKDFLITPFVFYHQYHKYFSFFQRFKFAEEADFVEFVIPENMEALKKMYAERSLDVNDQEKVVKELGEMEKLLKPELINTGLKIIPHFAEEGIPLLAYYPKVYQFRSDAPTLLTEFLSECSMYMQSYQMILNKFMSIAAFEHTHADTELDPENRQKQMDQNTNALVRHLMYMLTKLLVEKAPPEPKQPTAKVEGEVIQDEAPIKPQAKEVTEEPVESKPVPPAPPKPEPVEEAPENVVESPVEESATEEAPTEEEVTEG